MPSHRLGSESRTQWKRVACFLVAVLLTPAIAGCGGALRWLGLSHYRYGEGNLHYAWPIERVEVVDEDFKWPPRGSTPEPPDTLLAEGFRVADVAEGADFYAVVGQSHPECRLWLFDKHWRLHGEIHVPRGEQCDSASLRWDAGGHELAVHLSTTASGDEGRGERIGIVRPPDLRFQCISDSLPKDMGGGGSEWSPDGRVYTTVGGPTEDALLVLDPDTCRFAGIWSQPSDPAVGISLPLISPGGTWLTCERFAMRRPVVVPRIGILLINLRTGEGVEATSEDGSAYNHQPYRWESDNVLLFTRPAGDGRTMLYRAYLRGYGDEIRSAPPEPD